MKFLILCQSLEAEEDTETIAHFFEVIETQVGIQIFFELLTAGFKGDVLMFFGYLEVAAEAIALVGGKVAGVSDCE
jgi:hypothetical protein